jgi:putative ABC transport system permease protein
MSRLQSRLFYRIVAKNREVYALKIVTLAIAFACTTLITLFSLNEFGFDRFHRQPNSVIRVLQQNNSETFSGNRLTSRIPPSVFAAIRSWSRDSLIVSRVKVMGHLNIKSENRNHHDQVVHAADGCIADIFSFDIVNGSLDNFREKERTAMLSSTFAYRYFGTIRAAGKQLKVRARGDTVLFTVACVFKDYPQNSHENFNLFVRFDNSSIRSLQFDLEDAGVYGRILLGSRVHDENYLNSSMANTPFTYNLQPLPEIHFGPRVIGENAKHGDSYSILILICITFLILFLALSGFVNLTTLTLPHRSKEIAIKKLAGTTQKELLLTFARESFSLSAISMLIGLMLALLTSGLLDPILSINLIVLLSRADIPLLLITGILLIMVGIAPLFMTLRFIRAAPTRLLSTETITFPGFKRFITFIQLGFSIFLIVASIVIKRQVNFSLLKEPGRNHDQVVYLPYPEHMSNDDLSTLRTNWKKYNPNILDVIATSQLPNQIHSKEINSDFYFVSVDPGFVEFLNLKMIEGRGFKANDGDSIFLVNKKGREMLTAGDANMIGVVEDLGSRFNSNQPEVPLKISLASSSQTCSYLCVRVLEVDIRKTIQYLSTFFDRENPVSVSFIDKGFEEWLQYQDRLNSLSEALAVISAFLACCAIYGLSLSIVRDKLKQIAIRKLYGATTALITHLLVREFVRQIVVAVLIFGPITYLLLREWLRNFVYATHFNWMDPVFPIAYCLLIITILCGIQALGLNRANLTTALKE